MKFVPILFIFLFVAVFLTIFPNIFGGFETQHNMTVTNYTEEYDALTELTQTDMAVLVVIGLLLVVALLFILARVFL